ncbi:MAG: hypothetical protein JXA52_05075 [Planctomycetes bacterium]|nr:hypothetical protein [Planctomycetota bacterium]
MSLWSKIGIVISFLMIIDGLVCLVFIDRVEGWLRQVFPRANLVPITAIEILLGGLLGILILWWR